MTILQANYTRRSALRDAFQLEPQAGSLRLVTTVEFNLGCELVVHLSFGDCRVHVLLSGYVSRLGPDRPRARDRLGDDEGAAGQEIVVTFFQREQPKTQYLAQIIASEQTPQERRSCHRLPVRLDGRWRRQGTGGARATLEDISSAGTFVRTDASPPVGHKVLLDVEIPGLASTVPVVGQVVHIRQGPDHDGMGLRFVWRDRGGLVRLREILRRIEKPLSSDLLSGIGKPEDEFDERVETLVEPADPDDPLR